MGDGIFRLSKYLVKACSKAEIKANPYLSEWEKCASVTRKPIEFSFGIIDNRFSTLKVGNKLENEHDAVYLIMACVILHNLSIERRRRNGYGLGELD